MKIKLPAIVKIILDSLHAHGFEAYAVGGCVRDSILNREPDDWDITTSALPHQIKQVFQRTVDTGIAHGTVTVLVGSRACEVTTYRIDGAYSDSRHPDSVTFTSKLGEDLLRRDFTINAMAYNEEEGLIDLYGGMRDLQRKKICCVGNASDRFREDALRILRAVRFSAQLHFGIDRLTALAMMDQASNLQHISAERICSELVKLICSDHPEYLRVAYEAGITRVILPEFDAMMQTPQNSPYHIYNVGDHTLTAMQHTRKDKVVRLAMLLHDAGKPSCKRMDTYGYDHFPDHAEAGVKIADDTMRRLKLDNDTMHKVRTLILYHDWWMKADEKEIRRALHTVGKELFPFLLDIQQADTMGKSEYRRDERLRRIAQVARYAADILKRGDAIDLKDLAIGGDDLLAMGIPAGTEIGKLLSAALDLVLDDPAKNTREYLLPYLKNHRNVIVNDL